MNIRRCIFVQNNLLFLFGLRLGVELFTGSCVTLSVWRFKDLPDCSAACPPAVWEGSRSSTFPPALVIAFVSFCFLLSHPKKGEVIPHCGVSWHFSGG